MWYTLLDWPFFIIRTTSSRGENHYYCFVKWWTSVVGFLLADSSNLRTIFYLDGKHTYGGWDTINSQEISNQKREAITRLFTILFSCKKYLSIHYAFTMKNHDVFSLALFLVTKTISHLFRSVEASDAGKYECQVSTTPKLSHFVYLTVIGKHLLLMFPAVRAYCVLHWLSVINDSVSKNLGFWTRERKTC